MNGTGRRPRGVRPDRARHRPARQRPRRVLLGPGDDAAVVAAAGRPGRRDHRPAGRGPALPARLVRRAADVGRKAAAANLADIAAMGAVPTALLVGLAAARRPPGRVGARAGRRPARRGGAGRRGGRRRRRGPRRPAGRSRSPRSATSRAATRSPAAGARPGDLVAVAGRLGWAAAGLAVLSRGFRSPRGRWSRPTGARRRRTPRGRGPRRSAPPR